MCHYTQSLYHNSHSGLSRTVTETGRKGRWGKQDKEKKRKEKKKASVIKLEAERANPIHPNSLIPTPILAVTANQEFRACVNENTLARDALLAVGHLGWGSCVNLINTGQGNIFLAVGDVQNIVKRLKGLKLSVDKNIWIQTEHLQE